MGPANRAWDNVVGGSCQQTVGNLCLWVLPMGCRNIVLADPAKDLWELCIGRSKGIHGIRG